MCGEQAGLGKEGSRRKGRHVGGAWGAELRSGMEAQDAGVARLGCPFPETHGWYEGGVVALGDDVPVLKEGGGGGSCPEGGPRPGQWVQRHVETGRASSSLLKALGRPPAFRGPTGVGGTPSAEDGWGRARPDGSQRFWERPG